MQQFRPNSCMHFRLYVFRLYIICILFIDARGLKQERKKVYIYKKDDLYQLRRTV